MKGIAACALLVTLAVFIVPFAQSQGMRGMEMKGDMKGMDMKSDKKAQTHKASGTVSKLDAGKGTVTIAHGPVESMKWPPMTMTFKIKDKKMLDKLKQGDKIDFSFVQSGKDYTITQLR
jgi:Cu(I)/Ag(I) efflux system periplasmic protein CusF